MDDQEFHAWGEPCGTEGVTIPAAAALVRAAGRYPFATLLGVRRRGDREGLIFEYRVARPQQPPVPIRARERVAIIVSPDPGIPPRALALRKDFPDGLHFNLTVAGEPREFCLFDRPYREVRSRITPLLFLDRVGEWLSRAVAADIHHADQPLEPMLLNQDRVIFDEDLLADAGGSPILGAAMLSERPLLLRLDRLPDGKAMQDDTPGRRFLAFALKLEPQAHRVLGQAPGDLADLVELLSGTSADLLGAIGRFLDTLSDSDRLQAHRDRFLVVLIEAPRTRVEGGPVEATEWWSFLVAAPIAEVAVKVGVMGEDAGILGRLLGPPRPRELESIPVAALRSTFTLTRERARAMSGYAGASPRIAVVGAGALGSQVILNLARQGFGTWDIVDDDLLLPHNLARHALLRRHQGARKATVLAGEVRTLLCDEGAANALVADVLAPGDEAERVEAALRDAGLILDLSASSAVARCLVHADAAAPRISAFIGPTGRHLVVLSEGHGRGVRLDDLEQQFAAGVGAEAALDGLFEADAAMVAFAGSCREVSVQLPQEVVGIFAGIVAHFVKTRHATPQPSITIWEWSTASMDLKRHGVPVHPVVVFEREGWTVRVSSGVIATMRLHRRGRLPAETGGVLLGEFDHDRQIIYVAQALPAPADGEERPDSFVRGAAGLRDQVEAAAASSGGNLGYIGEWHSHPDGHDATPSALDREAARILAGEMGRVGLPALVLIQGPHGQPGVLLST